MNTAAEIIRHVQATGATIAADGYALKIRPASLVPPWLLDRVKAHKPELLAELTAANDPHTRPSDAAAEIAEAVALAVGQASMQATESALVRFKLTGGNGGQVIHPDGRLAAVHSLIARFGARLDVDDLVEQFEERAAIIAEGCNIPMAAAEVEALAILKAEIERRLTTSTT